MDHDELTAAVAALLADQTKPRDQRNYEAGNLLARGLAEEWVQLGRTFHVLETTKGVDGKDRTVNYLHAWGLNPQGQNKGYFGVFTSSGAILMYRVLKYAGGEGGPKPLAWDADRGEWEGGNDYVMIQRHQSPVVF